MSPKPEGEPKSTSREVVLQSRRFEIPDFTSYSIAATYVDQYHSIQAGSVGLPVDVYRSNSQEEYFQREVEKRYKLYDPEKWFVKIESHPNTICQFCASLMPIATLEEAERVRQELAKKQQQFIDKIRNNLLSAVDGSILLDPKFRSDPHILVTGISLEQPQEIVSSVLTACRVFQIIPESYRKIAFELELGANTISRPQEEDFLVILAKNKLWEITLEKEGDDVSLGVRTKPNRSDLQNTPIVW